MTAQIFISYSKKDSGFAHKLAEDLQAAGFEIWIDRSITGGEQWREKIESNLKSAKEVIVVLSQNALDSQWVPYEGALAVGLTKSIYPLLIEENISIPPWLHEVQYINFTDKSYQQALEELKIALTPPNPVQDLLDQELKTYRATGDLIGEAILRVIEESRPTLDIDDEAQKLITRSQQAIEARQKSELEKAQQLVDTQRQRTIVLAIGLLVAVILIAISVWFSQQSNKNLSDAQKAGTQAVANKNTAQAASTQAVANESTAQAASTQAVANEKIARSRQLAAQAIVLRDEQFDLALLLAIEASRGSTDGQRSLSSLLLAEPHLIRIISNSEDYFRQGEAGFINDLALSQDGNQLVARSDGNIAGFWDLNTHESRELSSDEYGEYRVSWALEQNSQTNDENPIYTPDIKALTGNSNIVESRIAFSACRTIPSAGGAPGCASLIYIFDTAFDRLVTPLASCSPTEDVQDFQIKLEGGLFNILDLQSVEDHPTNFVLYSVALANKASNDGSSLAGVLYDPSSKQLVTAASYGRHASEVAIILWDLDAKYPILEIFSPLWGTQESKFNFSNDGGTLDICGPDKSIQIDIDPESWREQACEIAGRNLTLIEWQQFIGDEPYRKTCPQWPAGE